MVDERTIAEIWEEDGRIVGYLWVTFSDIPDYDLTIAEVMDIAVADEYRRRGVGRVMLHHAEDIARKHGAALLRSDTGIENVASQKLHEKMGYNPYRIGYEKILRYTKAGANLQMGDFVQALDEAMGLLKRYGYGYEISPEDFHGYAEADTFYPSAISWEEILQNRLIVVHEVVEIAELKRMGLDITRDVVVRNVEQVYAAHLRATEVEMEIARAMGDVEHICDRLGVIEDWTDDPLVPPGLIDQYEALYTRTRQIITELEEHGR